MADPEDVEYSITRTAHGFGDQQADGSWKFFLELGHIHAFYFRPHGRVPKPVFHSDSKFTIEAELVDNQLTYTTKFYNYAFYPDHLMVLKTEKREADVLGHHMGSVRFLNSEALLLEGRSVSRRYINEEGAKLIGCEVKGFDYKRAPSPWLSQG